MDPITMMLLSQLLPTGINLAKSAIQGKQASELAKVQRPQYNIPQGVLDAVNQSKYLASMRELPGQNLMEARLGENTAKGIAEMRNVAANPADLASNVAKMYGAQTQGLQDIGIQAGQNWLGQQGQLSQMLQNLGQYQEKAWDYNQNQPYQQAKAAESALREGAFRNLTAAGTNIASGLSGAANLNYQQQALDKTLASQDNQYKSYLESLALGGGKTNRMGLGEAINTPSSYMPQSVINTQSILNSNRPGKFRFGNSSDNLYGV
jgi:hypothetical protein